MNFWEWLVHVGLIEGDWRAYATGVHNTGAPVTAAEYEHALRVALQGLQTASDPTAKAEFYRRLQEAGGLLSTDNLNYYISGQAGADEIENLISKASSRLRETLTNPSLPPIVDPPPPPGTTPPQAPGAPDIPDPTPDPETDPEPPEPFDYRQHAALLFPFLPAALLDIFADAWADTGDVNLALAMMRADPTYDTFFPGNRREDGSLRMSESEYFSRVDAYNKAFRGWGLNPELFKGKYADLIAGDVTGAVLANRIAAAHEQILHQMPQVREVYARYAGIELSDEAILATFLDPDVADGILSRRIAVSQVGAEGEARGFTINLPFAERLHFAGVDQQRAREFFTSAEGRVPTLDELARRFADPDPDFDIVEFAEAAVFGSASQERRVRRLLASEASLFSDQLGAVRTTGSDFALTGLNPV